MIGYNNSAPKAANNVGQFGATEGTIGAYKSAAEYAADAKYWALLSQTKYSSVEDILAEVERLYAQGLLLEEDIEQLKTDFETQQQELLGLIQSTGTAIDNTNAATELSKEATQQVLAQLDIISNMTVQTTLLPPGSLATGSYDNMTGVFSFGIPEGQPGRDGTDGTISDIGNVSIGTPVSDDYGFYVDKEDGGLYRASMSDIANLVPSIKSISINGGEEQTGAVSFNSVSSFNTRTGDILPMSGDYSVNQITGAAASGINSDITSLEGLTTALSVAQGGTGASTPEEARTNLELGSVSVENIVPVLKGGTGASTAEGARTSLGLGLVATESIVPITKGGTGSTSSENARLALVSAKSGDNYDITSLNNLTTALSITQGGTGVSSQSSIWGAIRPSGPTPLSADPVGPLDAATSQWVTSKISDASVTLNEEISGVSGDLNTLTSNLTSSKGLTYVGQLTSVAGFYNLVGTPGDRVILKGWYNGSTYGGGVFDYTTDVQRSQHDGGCIISPLVPYNGDALSGQYVNSTGGTSTLTYGCWVRRDVSEVRCEHYGMSGNPVANVDYYPHLSKAVLRAATDGKGVLLPPNACRINSPINVPMHQRPGGLVKYIRGYGEKTSILNFRAAATGTAAYGLTLDGSLSVFSSFKLSGFSMNAVDDSGNRSDWTGCGIKFNKVIRLDADNINIDGFEIGANMTDSLYLKFSNVRFSYNRTGLQGRFGELTGANAVDLVRCDFYNNAQFCVELQQSHAFKFDTCCFEANGGKSTSNGTPIGFNSCVQFAQVGGAGNVAGTFDTCYFENNTGTDISFYVNRNLNQIVNVFNTIFNYKSETSTAARVLVQSNLTDMSAGTQAILNIKGCGFWNITPATSPAYKDVQFAVPGTFGVSHLVFTDSGNKWSQSSAFSGLDKVFRTFDGSSIARCLVTGAGVASLGQNVAGVSKTGTGAYLINFTTSIANSIPIIDISSGSGRYANYTKPSDYSISVTTFNNAGGQVDLPFNIAVI